MSWRDADRVRDREPIRRGRGLGPGQFAVAVVVVIALLVGCLVLYFRYGMNMYR